MKWMEFLTSQEALDVLGAKEQIAGPLAVAGLTLPSNTLPVVFELQEYMDAGKSAPSLEMITPVKGPNLDKICVEVGSGMKTPLQGAQAYDEDVKTQAQQLGLEGW